MRHKAIILYNIRVNSKNRLKRLALHLASIDQTFYDYPYQVLINVRGIYKKQSEDLFMKTFKSADFNSLECENGWKYSTNSMLSNYDYDYVSWMIEDTYLISSTRCQLSTLVATASQHEVDFIPLSQYGASRLFNDDHSIQLANNGSLGFYVDTELIDEVAFQARSRSLRSGWETYPIWAFGIYSKATYEELLRLPDNDDQFFTPFGMEVPPPLANFPCRVAFPRNRLFVTFDDDQGFSGDSMVSRGLYNDTTNQTLLRIFENHVDHQRGVQTHVRPND